MTTLAATTDPTQAFDEDAWDDLLNYIGVFVIQCG